MRTAALQAVQKMSAAKIHIGQNQQRNDNVLSNSTKVTYNGSFIAKADDLKVSEVSKSTSPIKPVLCSETKKAHNPIHVEDQELETQPTNTSA